LDLLRGKHSQESGPDQKRSCGDKLGRCLVDHYVSEWKSDHQFVERDNRHSGWKSASLHSRRRTECGRPAVEKFQSVLSHISQRDRQQGLCWSPSNRQSSQPNLSIILSVRKSFLLLGCENWPSPRRIR